MKTPWQYEWKRPQVTELLLSSSADLGETGICPTCVTAALVDPSEHNLPITSALLLTITLYNDNGPIGHRMQLRLLHGDPPYTELQSRELRWPGSMLQENQEGGIVSVELCRKSYYTKALTSADALDVINLMSLGIVDVVSIQGGEKSSEEIEAVINSQLDHEPTELILACLTSHGHVHLYKALDLLRPMNVREQAENEFGAGMAALLLGYDVFKRVQESLYPLSQPWGTVQLSVPLKRNSHPKSRFSITFMHDEGRQEGRDLHVWDSSLWNATLELSTARHRTLNNIPTGMVSAFQYVVVFGRGNRMRRARNRKQEQSRDDVVLERLEDLSENDSNNITEQWWQGDADVKDGTPKPDESSPWWKAASGGDDVVDSIVYGGFVTFVDLHNAAESRTLYLPFAPKALCPFSWGDLAFVMVLADESTNPEHRATALAIRVDSSRKLCFDCGASPVSSASEEIERISADGRLVKKPSCEIRRFSLIPIVLPVEENPSSMSIRTTTVSSLLSSPPCIELLYSSRRGHDDVFDVALTLNHLDSFDLVSSSELPSYEHYADSLSSIPAIRTMQRVGNAARIPRPCGERGIEMAWSRAFQGCSFFYLGALTYFICWDGATEEEGAFVRELVDHHDDAKYDNVSCAILPLEHTVESSSKVSREQDVAATGDTKYELREPKTALTDRSSRDVNAFMPDNELGVNVSDIVIDALDSISSLSYRGAKSLLSPSGSPKLKRSQRLSHLEKSMRLVQKCDSWATLGDTNENRAMFETQAPVLISALQSHAEVFSLRHCFVRNGEANPFSQILSWMSLCEDYFTAACVALGLLGDVESWHNLKKLKVIEMGGFEDDQESLECLLDSIVPLYPKGADTVSPKQSVVSHVADMAIGCLAKGGLGMSTALNSFLKRNADYDPSKAALMLVAVATRCVSREQETVNIAMGVGYEYSANSNPEDLLWALRALLCVGVARDQLPQAIVLVNVATPDELRFRRAKGAFANAPPMDLCKAMVSTIIASSPDAASLILGLVDEESRKRYWGSLSREAQLEFSLINVEDRCPLLLQEEVRDWALKCLDKCVTDEESPTAVNLNDLMPIDWLRRLCEGCLLNADCDYGRILTYGVSDSTFDDDEGTMGYITEFACILEALKPTPYCVGLDFDLLIPALLIMQQREVEWNEDATVSTQRVLDAACYLAGRHRNSSFTFDGSKVMLQCASARNISAGANLVGGMNGMVLSCCDILMKGSLLGMAAAESFILDDDISLSVLTVREGVQKPFSVTDGHRQVLWLLLNHVLNVRTFGEFRPIHLRGKVDPVFAAQACLRTWWALSSTTDSTAWLVEWLRRNLEMESDSISPKRLACAALTQALIWPASHQSQDTLATIMGFESGFLVQLTQSCHGLLESIPVAMAEEIIAKADSQTPSSVSSVKIEGF